MFFLSIHVSLSILFFLLTCENNNNDDDDEKGGSYKSDKLQRYEYNKVSEY